MQVRHGNENLAEDRNYGTELARSQASVTMLYYAQSSNYSLLGSCLKAPETAKQRSPSYTSIVESESHYELNEKKKRADIGRGLDQGREALDVKMSRWLHLVKHPKTLTFIWTHTPQNSFLIAGCRHRRLHRHPGPYPQLDSLHALCTASCLFCSSNRAERCHPRQWSARGPSQEISKQERDQQCPPLASLSASLLFRPALCLHINHAVGQYIEAHYRVERSRSISIRFSRRHFNTSKSVHRFVNRSQLDRQLWTCTEQNIIKPQRTCPFPISRGDNAQSRLTISPTTASDHVIMQPQDAQRSYKNEGLCPFGLVRNKST